MGCSRIKQNFSGMTTDKESTRQHYRSLGNVNHGGEVQFALLDLHHGLLALITLAGP
jgi:hypothetical protein